MGDSESQPIRRQPPEWLRVEVSGSRTLAPWLTLVTLSGTPLITMDTPGVAASLRLLIPGPDDDDLVIPSWSGNEFLLPSGERPLIRTFTPLRFDAGSGTLELAVVVHPSGSASDWVSSAHPGDRAAVSGPGRGWDPPPGLRQITLLGDASAVPAIGQVVAALGADVDCEVHLAVPSRPPESILAPASNVSLRLHETGSSTASGQALVSAADGIIESRDDCHVWAAGEAAAMQAIRKHLHGTLGIPRDRTTIRGYWKAGR